MITKGNYNYEIKDIILHNADHSKKDYYTYEDNCTVMIEKSTYDTSAMYPITWDTYPVYIYIKDFFILDVLYTADDDLHLKVEIIDADGNIVVKARLIHRFLNMLSSLRQCLKNGNLAIILSNNDINIVTDNTSYRLVTSKVNLADEITVNREDNGHLYLNLDNRKIPVDELDRFETIQIPDSSPLKIRFNENERDDLEAIINTDLTKVLNTRDSKDDENDFITKPINISVE